MTFDKTISTRLHKEFIDTVRALAERHGLDFKPSRASFSPTSLRVGGEFLPRSVGGLSREQAEFNRCCQLFGLRPEDFGKWITKNGELWRFTGIESSRPKFAYRMQRASDGKVMLHTDAVVERIRAAAAPPADA